MHWILKINNLIFVCKLDIDDSIVLLISMIHTSTKYVRHQDFFTMHSFNIYILYVVYLHIIHSVTMYYLLFMYLFGRSNYTDLARPDNIDLHVPGKEEP